MAKAVVAALRDAGSTRGPVAARNACTGDGVGRPVWGYTWRPSLASAGRSARRRDPGRDVGWSRRRQPPGGAEVVDAAETVFDVVALPALTPRGAPRTRPGRQVITGAEVIALQRWNNSSSTPASAPPTTRSGAPQSSRAHSATPRATAQAGSPSCGYLGRS
jgi:shikimate dehydrogenase